MKNIQSGQILILGIVVVSIILINALIIAGGSMIFSQNSKYTVESTQAVNLAEAGVDKALSKLNATGGAYLGDSETALDTGSFSTTITSPDSNTKIIESTGYVPNKSNPKSKKTIKIKAARGVGASFNYGVQVGNGGLEMSNNSKVVGSVYSNNNIDMSNGSQITGDAYVAGGVAAAPDQQSICTPPNCADFLFGTNVSGNSRADIAQSFKPSATNTISKVSLNLKKIGSPSDIQVRILTDSAGSPNKNSVLATGTLYASLVTTSYGFVDVAFTTNPSLTANTTYWLMLDTTINTTNYWSWNDDSLQGYSRGVAKWSTNWSASSPVWNATTVDLDFKTFMGGVATHIAGSGTIGGDAHANTLDSITVQKNAYYQILNSATVNGTKYPGTPDPPSIVPPISDANIQAWKDLATSLGVHVGNVTTCPATLGPGKYVGNITLDNNCTVTMTDPVWVTGNLTLSNNVTFKLPTSYGLASGVVVVDGKIILSNNVLLQGSGTTGSYMIAISNFDSTVNGQYAIDINNTGNQGVLYTNLGIANIGNNNALTEISAWKLNLSNNVTITYDSGLASTVFKSGPSGSYALVKGTYQSE